MAKPFLKWAGGKKWFINQERDRLPLHFNRYIEPFLGGGSVFFYINPQQAILSDINNEFVYETNLKVYIKTYIYIKSIIPKNTII